MAKSQKRNLPGMITYLLRTTRISSMDSGRHPLPRRQHLRSAMLKQAL